MRTPEGEVDSPDDGRDTLNLRTRARASALDDGPRMARSQTGPRRSLTSPSIHLHDGASGPTVRSGHAVLVLMESMLNAATPAAHGHVMQEKNAARQWTAHA